MEQKHRTILRDHWSNICDDLEPMNILPKFVTALRETDKEQIRKQSTKQERCDKLLRILLKRGENAFDELVNALNEEAPDLALKLTEAVTRMENKLIDARKQSAKLLREIRRPKTEAEEEKQDHRKNSQELEELKRVYETLRTENQELSQIIQRQKEGSSSRCEDLRNERDSARRKNQTLEKEIQVLKEKSEDYKRKNQALQKNLESVKEKQGHLQLLSENLEAEKKKQQGKIIQLKRKNKNLENEVAEKMLAHEQELRKTEEDCLQKALAQIKAKDVELENMRVENKRLHEDCNTERSKCDALGEEVTRLREMRGQNDDSHATEQSPKTSQDLQELKSLHEALKVKNGELSLIIQQQREKRDKNDFSYATEQSAKTSQELKELKSPYEALKTKNQELPQIHQQQREESCSRCERFRNERDSARRKIQILEKEIQVLKKNSEDCEGINQTLHKNLENLKEEQGNLQLPLENLEVVKKEQQGKITKLTRKNKELENKVTKKTSEIEKILAREQKLKKKVEECVKKSLKDTKTKDVELEKMSVENKLLYEENKRLHEENKRLHEESNVVRSNWDKLREQVKRWKLRLREMPERLYIHREDFDKHGVVYAFANKFGGKNSSRTRIIATRSSDGRGTAKIILENQLQQGIVSATKAKKNSWWCVDLTENYALYLTHYTLRHGQEQRGSVLRRWRLEGSVDGCKWTVLKNHNNDHGLGESKSHGSHGSHGTYCTCTWAIDGELNAFRYFRIFQTGVNSSGKFGIFLSGIELYGVLVEIG